MTENYTITFNSEKGKMEPDFLRSLASWFAYRNIKTENNINTHHFYQTTYQTNQFRVEYEYHPTFGNILHITTDFKTSIFSLYQGFIQLIKDVLVYHKQFHHSEIEVFYTKSFRELQLRAEERFLSRKSVCDFLELPNQKLIDVELHTQTFANGQITVYNASCERQDLSTELLWCSIAEKRDYDGWDMTSMEFIPISQQAFEQETNEFIKWWQFDFQLPGEFTKDTIAVLRNMKDWNTCEYLVLTDKYLHYIHINVWTG